LRKVLTTSGGRRRGKIKLNGSNTVLFKSRFVEWLFTNGEV